MLTTETVKQQKELVDLTEAQLNAIVALSNNTTSRAKGVLRGQLDTDIKRITGIEKDGNEKLHIYLERAVTDPGFKGEDNTELNKTIETLKNAKADLEAKIKEGSGSEAIIKERDTLITQLRANEDTLKKDYEQKILDRDNKYNDTIIDGYLNKAIAGLTFKSKEMVSPEDRERYVNSVSKDIKELYNPKVVSVDGKDSLQFFQDGEILRNSSNKSYPYTATELLESRLGLILDKGQNQKGGGTKGVPVKQKNNINISQATTQVQADEIMEKQLLANGVEKGTAAFAEEHAKLRNENDISKLPVQ